MAEPVEPHTPEEAALRELATRPRRQHRWLALGWSVTASRHATLIRHTVRHDRPLDARDLGPPACFAANALGGLGWLR